MVMDGAPEILCGDESQYNQHGSSPLTWALRLNGGSFSSEKNNLRFAKMDGEG